MKKRILAWILTMVMILSVTVTNPVLSMNTQAASEKYVKSLSVKKSVTVTVGGKVTIKPTVKATKKTSTAVKVKVKNKKIAKVAYSSKTKKITVQGKKIGKTDVTVSTVAKNKKGKVLKKTIKVNVTKKAENSNPTPDPAPTPEPNPAPAPTPAPTPDDTTKNTTPGNKDNDSNDKNPDDSGKEGDKENEKDDDNKEDDNTKNMSLSDVSFGNDGYSLPRFEVNCSMKVSDYIDFGYYDDGDDDIWVTGFSFIDDSGEIQSANPFAVVSDSSGNGYILQGTAHLKIGNYKVFYDGFYCGVITKEDFTNLKTRSLKNYYADMELITVNPITVSGKLTFNGGSNTESGYVIVKQKVEGKEYTNTVWTENDGTYSVSLLEGYDYEIIPMGLKDEKVMVQVKEGKVNPASLDIVVKTTLKTALVELDGFDDEFEDNVIELKSDSADIRVQNICEYDEEEDDYTIVGYKVVAPIGVYDVYCNGYLIEKGVEITETTQQITLSKPIYTVTLKKNGEEVDLTDYTVRVGYRYGGQVQIDKDALTFEVESGAYEVFYKGVNVGKYIADKNIADENGNIVWEIYTANVSLKNFNTSLNIGDYILKDSDENEIWTEAGAESVKLCAGTYYLYKENENETEESLGTFTVTVEQAMKGEAVWDLELATVSGIIELPGNVSYVSRPNYSGPEYSKDTEFILEVHDKNSYRMVKKISLGKFMEPETNLDPENFSWGCYKGKYSINLKKGEYVFVLKGTTYDDFSCYSNVKVDEDNVSRDLEFVSANINITCSNERDMQGIMLDIYVGKDKHIGGFGLNNSNSSVSPRLDRNSTYTMYIEDSAWNRKLISDSYCYGEKTSDTIAVDDIVSNVYTYTLPSDERYDFLRIESSEGKTSGTVSEKDGQYKIKLFEDGIYTTYGGTYGVSYSEHPKIGTLTLSNGVFTYTPEQ